MPTSNIPIKYCKSLIMSGVTNSSLTSPNHVARFFDKVLYEFWGFCVNGTADPVNPNGIETVSYPLGFESGSLLAHGTDGATAFATDVFRSDSVDFTTINRGALTGKYLVVWDPKQQTTDDSVYFIKSIEDAHHLKVDIHNGGTRRLGNHPYFWKRDGINWRIVDIAATTLLTGWKDGHSMVLDFAGAPLVNPGSGVPQMRVFHRTGSNGSEGTVGLVFSPGGTWNGSSFTDGTPEDKQIWFGLAADGSGGHTIRGNTLFTLIGGQDFLIGEGRSSPEGFETPQVGMGGGSGLHVEVPTRSYSAAADKNPLAWLTWSGASPSQVAASYYNGFKMVGFDGNVHQWTTLVRSPMGTQVNPTYTGNSYGAGQWQQFGVPAFRFAFISFDSDAEAMDQYITTDGLLHLSTPGQFSAGRARLRKVRFCSSDLKYGARIGDPIRDHNGWVHVANGVMWPWDNSIMPEGPWRFGT